jgi:hypothetical protein
MAKFHRNLSTLTADDIIIPAPDGKAFSLNTKRISAMVAEEVRYNMNEVTSDSMLSKNKEIINLINLKLETFEQHMLAYFDYKVQKVSDNIFEKTLSHLFEEEVNKRVRLKILENETNKYKNKGKF